MKKIALIAVLIFGCLAATVYAGGDKNCIRHQGDNGQGSVVQHQVKVNNLTP